MGSLVLTEKSLPGRDADQFTSEKAAPVAGPFPKERYKAVSRSWSLGVADRLAARPLLKAFCLGKHDCTSGSLHPLGLIWTQGSHAQNELPRPCQADLASARRQITSEPPAALLRELCGWSEVGLSWLPVK